jgi:hypothetical protein
MLHRRNCARFLPDVTLGIRAKEFNLGFIRPEDLVSYFIKNENLKYYIYISIQSLYSELC